MRLVKALVLSAILTASAALPALANVSPGDWELYGGLTHQRITAAVTVDGEQVSESSGPDLGWHLGSRYWFHPKFAVGVKVDGLGSTTESSTTGLTTESTGTVLGLAVTADYLALSGENWRGLVQVGVGSYLPQSVFKMADDLGNELEMEVEAEAGLGFLIGGQFSTDITERLSLDATANYRWFSSEVKNFVIDGEPIAIDDSEFELNSWGVGVGVTYRF